MTQEKTAQELINESIDFNINEDSTDQSISDVLARQRLKEKRLLSLHYIK